VGVQRGEGRRGGEERDKASLQSCESIGRVSVEPDRCVKGARRMGKEAIRKRVDFETRPTRFSTFARFSLCLALDSVKLMDGDCVRVL